ncbi:MAG TPA: monovalent cation/H+ antiporter complex subunit F [Prolixibacteraceae bacterium]|nr:monovalent cation/H+ antiporter complex subunit F [Prolixibacteraceae bacterium]
MIDTLPVWVIYTTFLFLFAAMGFSLYRLLAGPTINDRIAAMDLVASIVMGLILAYAVLIRNALLFDVPVIISLISFISTVAVSTYLKQKHG